MEKIEGETWLPADWIYRLQNPDINEPDLIGRSEGSPTDDLQVRGPTRMIGHCSAEFDGAAMGCATVDVFVAGGKDSDEGGAVLQCKLRNDGSAMLPHVKEIEGGFELHLAGTTEARHVLQILHRACSEALAALENPKARIRAKSPED